MRGRRCRSRPAQRYGRHGGGRQQPERDHRGATDEHRARIEILHQPAAHGAADEQTERLGGVVDTRP